MHHKLLEAVQKLELYNQRLDEGKYLTVMTN